MGALRAPDGSIRIAEGRGDKKPTSAPVPGSSGAPDRERDRRTVGACCTLPVPGVIPHLAPSAASGKWDILKTDLDSPPTAEDGAEGLPANRCYSV